MKPVLFDIQRLRLDFPILEQQIHSKPLAYLDNAASTHKPRRVISAMQHFYTFDYSNVHRGVHALSERASDQFEQARKKLQHFIRATSEKEIIWVRGTTEGINLVAQSYARPRLVRGDEILISHMEHHANIIPWQQVCQQTGAQLKIIPVTESGELDWIAAKHLLNSRTKLLAVTHLSNVLGTLNPIQQLIEMAHQQGATVLVDGAQAVPHLPIDVHSLDCDFYVFSGHKMYGPNGIGVLYAKAQWLNEMSPWQTGGGMIRQVSFEQTTYADPPYRFEAGTPAIAEAIGLGATVDYLQSLDFQAISRHEQALFEYTKHRLLEIPHLRLIGDNAHQIAVLSFVVEGIHAHDLATILDSEGVAVRAGHHCAMPLIERFQVPATVRVSLACYNTQADIERLMIGLKKAVGLLGRTSLA